MNCKMLCMFWLCNPFGHPIGDMTHFCRGGWHYRLQKNKGIDNGEGFSAHRHLVSYLKPGNPGLGNRVELGIDDLAAATRVEANCLTYLSIKEKHLQNKPPFNHTRSIPLKIYLLCVSYLCFHSFKALLELAYLGIYWQFLEHTDYMDQCQRSIKWCKKMWKVSMWVVLIFKKKYIFWVGGCEPLYLIFVNQV